MSRRWAVRFAAAVALGLAIAPAAAPALAASGGGVTSPQALSPKTVTATTNATSSVVAGASTTLTASSDPNALVGVPGDQLNIRPLGHRLTGAQAQSLADRVPKIINAEKKNKGSYPGVFMKGPGLWQISYYGAGKPLREIGQVTVVDASASVKEAWTGYQVPWTMARGYPGAFGKNVNSLWVWLPLCVLFIVPFIDPRRPFRWLHLDLLVLLGFSVSFAYFNHGTIGHSVPILYPLFTYLLVRMLWIGLRRNGREREPLKLLVPASWLIVATVFLIGFRIGLNVVDSNVIDVGDASQVGANLVVHGKRVYHNFPQNISQGDTYGATTYAAYVPFVKAFGFDENHRPATHAAAIAFDLLTIILLFFLGRRIRGPTLGAALAYAWVTYPFTIYVSSTNSNDGLVALMLVVTLIVAARPALRGAAAALAGFTKMAPLALVPVLALHQKRVRPVVAFSIGFALMTVLIWLPFVIHGPSLHDIYNRTIGFQAGRDAPFSIWGYPDTGFGKGAQQIWQVLTVAVAIVLAFVPRRRDVIGLAAICGAIMIMVEMGATYWFYLYIAWFFPLVMVAFLGEAPEPSPLPGDEPDPISESAAPHEPIGPGPGEPEPELAGV